MAKLSREEALAELARRRFAADPALYIKHVLKGRLTPDQERVVESVRKHRRTMVPASHGVGKSNLMGSLVNWHFDCHDPGITITTAPTKIQVIDVLWKEVRRQRGPLRNQDLHPKSPRLETSPDHFAVGLTATSDSAFQGRHEEHVMIVLDEAVAVDSPFWDAAEGMMTTPERRLVAIFNPTNTNSRAFTEFCTGEWNIEQISALDHPNILAGLRKEPPPFPAAVQLEWVEEKIRTWCEDLAGVHKPTDFEWPPGSGKWFRPGPLFESRVLGRWPSQATNAVWSQAAWQACTAENVAVPEEPLVLGVDVARFGDDDTTIHARRGRVSVFHGWRNGYDTRQTTNWIREVIMELKQEGEDPRSVLVAIDDAGVGGGVVDQADGWNFWAVNSGSRARDWEAYPNTRSELWFASAEMAADGLLNVSRLPKECRDRLMTQLLAPTYRVDSQGRRVVEPKEDTKKRIKRSPDDADAFNLCHYGGSGATLTWTTL